MRYTIDFKAFLRMELSVGEVLQSEVFYLRQGVLEKQATLLHKSVKGVEADENSGIKKLLYILI